MEGTTVMETREDELLKQAERLGRESGLEEKLERYRDRRRAYEETVRGPATAPSLPATPRDREVAASRRESRGSTGDGLF
jgi:hypothetical protein